MLEFHKRKERGLMTGDELDFVSGFETDDELEEATESLLDAIAEEVEDDESRTSIIDPLRMRAIQHTYKAISYLVQNSRTSKAKVSYKLNEPFQSMGSVTVSCKHITLRRGDMRWFMLAVKLASNFEIYPKTDGTINITFTFHNLTQPIE